MNNQATTLRNDLIKIRKHLEITSIYFKEDGDNNRRIFIYPSDDIIDLGEALLVHSNRYQEKINEVLESDLDINEIEKIFSEEYYEVNKILVLKSTVDVLSHFSPVFYNLNIDGKVTPPDYINYCFDKDELEYISKHFGIRKKAFASILKYLHDAQIEFGKMLKNLPGESKKYDSGLEMSTTEMFYLLENIILRQTTSSDRELSLRRKLFFESIGLSDHKYSKNLDTILARNENNRFLTLNSNIETATKMLESIPSRKIRDARKKTATKKNSNAKKSSGTFGT